MPNALQISEMQLTHVLLVPQAFIALRQRHIQVETSRLSQGWAKINEAEPRHLVRYEGKTETANCWGRAETKTHRNMPPDCLEAKQPPQALHHCPLWRHTETCLQTVLRQSTTSLPTMKIWKVTQNVHKKLHYRWGTAWCTMSVEILSTVAQLTTTHIWKACNRTDLEGDSRSLELPVFDKSYITSY